MSRGCNTPQQIYKPNYYGTVCPTCGTTSDVFVGRIVKKESLRVVDVSLYEITKSVIKLVCMAFLTWVILLVLRIFGAPSILEAVMEDLVHVIKNGLVKVTQIFGN